MIFLMHKLASSMVIPYTEFSLCTACRKIYVPAYLVFCMPGHIAIIDQLSISLAYSKTKVQQNKTSLLICVQEHRIQVM